MATSGGGEAGDRRVRARLSRAVVLRAAVELADAEGLSAVNMRRLADELGVVPMALYKNVADKEDLLDGMVDSVIAEFEPAVLQRGRWKAAARATVMSAHDAIGRHPWARRAIESRTVRTAAVLGHMEALTSLMIGGGLSPDLVHHAMHALGNRIWGFSPELFNSVEGRPARAATAPDVSALPGIMAVAADAAARRPGAVGCDEEFEFGFAVDLLLDGIERLHRAGWASAAR